MAQDMYTNPNYQPTTSSPVGNFPELWKYMDLVNSGTMSDTQSSGMTSMAETIMEEQRKAKAAAEAAAAKKKAKYSRVRKKDGGFDFFDGDGNPVNAAEYAQMNDISISDALEGSENGMDKAYMNDIKLLSKLDEANAVGDVETVEKLITDAPEAANFTPRELIIKLRETYPGIFQGTKKKYFGLFGEDVPNGEDVRDLRGFNRSRQDIYKPWSS